MKKEKQIQKKDNIKYHVFGGFYTIDEKFEWYESFNRIDTAEDSMKQESPEPELLKFMIIKGKRIKLSCQLKNMDFEEYYIFEKINGFYYHKSDITDVSPKNLNTKSKNLLIIEGVELDWEEAQSITIVEYIILE